jgi:hypothetical protein
MQNSDFTTVIKWKKAPNGLIAHLYEHIIGEQISAYMTRHEQLLLLDYDLWAQTYGTSCFITARFQTLESERLYKEAIEAVQSIELSFSMVERAAGQCSAEYERPLIELGSLIHDDIMYLHEQSWLPVSEFGVEQATDETSVNTLFEYADVRYGRRRPQSFTRVFAEYSVSGEVYEDKPAMKALSILVVQALALNINNALNEDIIYYDSGDEWAEGSSEIGYRTLLVFSKKNAPSLEDLQDLFVKEQEHLLHEEFINKCIRLVRDNYEDESRQYFATAVHNRITGGIVIGPVGWKTVASADNLRDILKSLEIKFYLAD